MRRLGAIVRKELLQFLRDRMLVALIFFVYTADVLMCTYALSFDVKNLKLAVYDQDASEASRALVERFTATEYFGSLVPVGSQREVDRALDAGRADLALVVPPDFGRAVAAGRPAEVQLLLSGVNSNTANVARGYAAVIIEGFAHDQLRAAAQARGLRLDLPEIRAQTRVWYNPDLAFHHFMVVSMIVIAAFMVGVISTAASFVREKETGTVEQLLVTPLARWEVVVAKSAPPLATGMIALLPGLAIARGFGVPLGGSLGLFFAASAAALATCLGIGIFVSTFARNLQQALLISFFILFPVMFLSGTTVPVESMPAALQYLSALSPIRYYLEIALGTLLKGVGWEILWPKLVVLVVIGSVLTLWSLRRLKRRFAA
jgi:ABC-2 type transport system permease protein